MNTPSINVQDAVQQNLFQNQLNSKVYLATIGDSVNNLYTHSRVKFDIDNQNRIYLTNPNTNSVDLYSIKGEKLGSIGRRGYGPGELLRLKTFDFSSDYKTIYLLGELEIEVFEYNNYEYNHLATIEHGFLRVYDMCVLDDKIYESGYAVNKNEIIAYQNDEFNASDFNIAGPILKLNSNRKNNQQDSFFGFLYEASSPMPTYGGMLSQSNLECDEQTNTIISQMVFFPYTIGYDTSGSIKWVNKLVGLRSTKVTESYLNNSPQLTMYDNDASFDAYTPFRNIQFGKHSFLQSFEMLPQSAGEKEYSDFFKNLPPLKSFLINNENGDVTVFDTDDEVLFSSKEFLMIAERNNGNMLYKIYKHAK